MRRLCLIFWVFLLLCSSWPPPAQAQPATAGLSDPSLEVIAAINTYRMSKGIMPLSLNQNLVDMARSQAEFLATQNFEPPNFDYHIDAKGEYPRQRGLRFKWRPYADIPVQIQVGENAGLGDQRFVMNYWSNSQLHRTAMENPIYREIGVWTIPASVGYMYIIVFGSRPDTFPAPFDPTTCELYIADEAYNTGTGTWMKNIEQVTYINFDETIIAGPVPHQERMILPQNAPSEFILQLTQANRNLRQNIRPLDNILILPQTLPILRGQQPMPTNCTSSNLTAQVETPLEALQDQIEEETGETELATVNEEAVVVPEDLVGQGSFLETDSELAAAPPPPSAATELGVAAPAGQTAPSVTLGSPSPPVSAITQGLPPSEVLTGAVALNPGSNLHCRMYPDSSSQSLTLIPANAEVVLRGVPGPRDVSGEVGFRDAPQLAPLDLAIYVGGDASLAAALTMNSLWLWTEWTDGTGLTWACWLNAAYINVSYERKFFTTVADYLPLLEEGLLDSIPYNTNGGQVVLLSQP
jgi:uncharacterized protein YkwD